MAYERDPNDPYRSDLSSDDLTTRSRLERELQPDPELAEGPASTGKVMLFAAAIAIILGALFYGLNNTSVQNAGTSSTAQNTQSAPPPARPNTEKGTTTGTAPPHPASPPAAKPAGADADRAKQ